MSELIELPEWPSPFRLRGNKYAAEWERARADAAMARLRVAVEALMRIRDHTIDEDDIAAIALQQIGELP